MSETQTQTKTCEVHGEFTSTCIGSKHFGPRWSGCPTCAAQQEALIQAEEASRQEAFREARRNEALDAAGIPPRYRTATFEGWAAPTEHHRQALAACREFAEGFDLVRQSGKSMILFGTTGTGKTHLATAIALAVHAKGYRAMYTTVAGLTRRIKSTWGEGRLEEEHQVLAQLHTADLLILDEVGVQSNSEWEKTHLFDLVNERYNWLRPTLVISNLDLAGIHRTLGERVIDRLRQAGGRAVRFEWESYRKQAPA